MRYGVDPGELQAAAAAVMRVAEQTSAARQTLNQLDGGVGTWCPDAALAGIVRDALDALDAAAHAAGQAAQETARALIVAAENYAHADTPVPK